MLPPIDWDSQVSPHFGWWEVTRTDHRLLADRNRQALLDGAGLQENARWFAETHLEPLRLVLGCPMHINSWFRFDLLNAAVGGAVDSRHKLGVAADFVCPGLSVGTLFGRVTAHVTRAAGRDWDELILEPRGRGRDSWIHLSALPKGMGTNRRLVLT